VSRRASDPSRSASGERELRVRVASWWNPRRSLGARLLWVLLAVTLVPVALYWILADRFLSNAEEGALAVLLEEAVGREGEAAAAAADARVRSLEDDVARLRRILAETAAAAARALQAGAAGVGPRETLVEVRGGPYRAKGASASAALVSRAAAAEPRALRDLAATRRLEEPFAALLVGHPDLSAVSILTASGVLRVVPGGDIGRFVAEGSVPADFRAPTQTARPLAARPAGEDPVAWSTLYEDVYTRRGRVVTAMTLVRDRAGEIAAEVGVDWTVADALARGVGRAHGADAEILFAGDGHPPVVAPQDALQGEELGALTAVVAREGAGDFERKIHGEGHLVAVRKVEGLPWLYARVSSLGPLRARVRAQAQAIFGAEEQKRNRLRAVYVALIAGLAALVAVVTRRTVEPIRKVARFADAIMAGGTPPDLEGAEERADEVGRLATAMQKLATRIRRRIASMESTHQLAQTASVMTSPEETYARLTRLVAGGLGATKCWLCLWEPETRSLVLTPPAFGIPDDALRGRRLSLADRSLAVHCYRTGETFLVNDVLSDPRVSLSLAETLGVKQNAAFVPLKTEIGVVGVLAVADKPGGFDAEDHAALESCADQAALLLRNARLYDELQRSYERLRDAQRNRDYFLQNVNHELRTPLTAILGWSEILAEDRPDVETVKTAMDQIRRSAQFLLALISDLLDLSRFQDGRTRLEPEDVDVGALVQEAIEPVSIMAEGKGIALTVSAPRRGEAVVRLDPVRLRQVLWNLVHNSVKFTPRGGRIEVEASVDGAGARFSVKDSGVGIDAKDLPFIFERFRQADGGTTRAFRGMGIGLALVKAFVELHGGTVQVESTPGRGTTMTVRIPRPPAPPAAA
jgi:signal transduction histidine kinase/HAMP domain-containing protein